MIMVKGRPDVKYYERSADVFPELPGVLHTLHSLGIQSLMVEGGAQIIDSFVKSGLVDRLVVTVAPVVVGPLGIGYSLDPASLAKLSFQASEGMGIDHVISFLSR
jgi:2,5-diamino-6-(ribosylamino)-4(3H)-pyrimidinone 5'-phosphate reductase